MKKYSLLFEQRHEIKHSWILFPFINELEYTIDLKLNKILISIIHVFVTGHLCFVKLGFHLNGFMSK